MVPLLKSQVVGFFDPRHQFGVDWVCGQKIHLVVITTLRYGFALDDTIALKGMIQHDGEANSAFTGMNTQECSASRIHVYARALFADGYVSKFAKVGPESQPSGRRIGVL